MSHITFYRKYRSRNFKEIVGQDHVVQTLENAITYDRLTHAYIFSGPRGTGKTSAARILAKVLNCQEGHEKDPYLTCPLCHRISTGNCVDIIEIDAASNTGVDNIRTLNEQVNFAPVECTYKLYIIDEAHMLSTGAFNALLKTLEEPPSKTIFVLATTEPHKIPVTIHSRCQHLYFRSVTSSDIVRQLRIIADAEQISIDDKSLYVIARNSGGSMRDAVSLLDQIYSFKGTQINLEDVLLSLGATQWDHLLILLGHILNKDAKKALSNLQEITDSGVNIIQLTADMTTLVKQALFIKLGLSEELDLDDERLQKLQALIASNSAETIQILLEMLAKIEMELRWFSDPKLLLQIRLLMFIKDQSPPQEIPVKQEQKQEAKIEKIIPKPFAEPIQKIIEKPVEIRIEKPVERQVVPPTPQSPQWAVFLEKIKTVKQGLYIILNGSTVTEMTDTEVHVKLKQDIKFFREKLKESENQKLIETVMSEVFGKPLKLSLPGSDTTVPTVPSESPIEFENSVPVIQEEPAEKSKKINQIIAMFDGTLVS